MPLQDVPLAEEANTALGCISLAGFLPFRLQAMVQGHADLHPPCPAPHHTYLHVHVYTHTYTLSLGESLLNILSRQSMQSVAQYADAHTQTHTNMYACMLQMTCRVCKASQCLTTMSAHKLCQTGVKVEHGYGGVHHALRHAWSG